jgi:hypothetical protein
MLRVVVCRIPGVQVLRLYLAIFVVECFWLVGLEEGGAEQSGELPNGHALGTNLAHRA